MRAAAARGIRIHAQHPHFGDCFAEVLLDALRPGTEQVERRAAALRADDGGLVRRPAVVAAQQSAILVIRERDTAVVAFAHVAAVTALHLRREAAAVVENDARFLLLHAVAQRVEQPLGERAPQPVLPARFGQIHEGETRKCRAVDSLGKREQSVLPALRVVPAFGRRGGRSEKDGRCVEPPAHDGDIASVVARHHVRLLVAPLLFLVDDDQSDIVQRCEYGRPHAHHHAVFTGQRQPPGIVAFAEGHAAVHDGDVLPERLPEAIDELRCERDFRNEHQCIFSPAQHVLDCLDVHLRLSAAGHAVQQHGGMFPGIDGGRHCSERAGLVVGQRDLLVFLGVAKLPLTRDLLLEYFDDLLLLQRPHLRTGCARVAHEIGHRHGALARLVLFPQRRKDVHLLRGARLHDLQQFHDFLMAVPRRKQPDDIDQLGTHGGTLDHGLDLHHSLHEQFAQLRGDAFHIRVLSQLLLGHHRAGSQRVDDGRFRLRPPDHPRDELFVIGAQ